MSREVQIKKSGRKKEQKCKRWLKRKARKPGWRREWREVDILIGYPEKNLTEKDGNNGYPVILVRLQVMKPFPRERARRESLICLPDWWRKSDRVPWLYSVVNQKEMKRERSLGALWTLVFLVTYKRTTLTIMSKVEKEGVKGTERPFSFLL